MNRLQLVRAQAVRGRVERVVPNRLPMGGLNRDRGRKQRERWQETERMCKAVGALRVCDVLLGILETRQYDYKGGTAPTQEKQTID